MAKKDVTKLLEDEIHSFIEKYPTAENIVLKSKSPSCGLGTTPVINITSNIITYGDGIAASIFKKQYKNSDIKDENMIMTYK